MSNKKVVAIYGIVNLMNGKCYVGHAGDYDKRISSHKSILRNNKHKNKNLQADWNEYGEDNFEFILLENCIKSELPKKEKYWKKLCDNTYNINEIHKMKKKIRRGREAKNFKEKWSLKNQGENNPHCTKMNKVMASEVLWLKKNSKMTYKEIANIYGINENNVARCGWDRWLSVKVFNKPDWYDDDFDIAM